PSPGGVHGGGGGAVVEWLQAGWRSLRAPFSCTRRLPPRVDTGWDRALCDSGARRFERKVLARRTDPDRPDDGGEREGCHEHREVFTDARTWPGGERDELPAVAVHGVLRAEPIGVKDQRALP